jgi:GTPase SAR1 family protein
MGWFDFLWNLFAAFGWETKTGRIIFLGLDNAGKTTLLGKLATNQVHVHRPTQHPNTEDPFAGLLLGAVLLSCSLRSLLATVARTEERRASILRKDLTSSALTRTDFTK